MSAPATTSKHPRVSKANWLDAGLRKITTKGVDGVRVERLARSLGVAKSGFYWHFEDRNDYLGQLLEHWDKVSTDSVLSDARVIKGAPKQRLSRVMQLVEAGDLPSYDIALHAWAREDARARAVVSRAIRRREEFIGSILRDAGFEDEDLEMRATLFVTYVSNEKSYFGFKSKGKRERLRKRFLDLLLK
jgi:AcrR family transcriptional regulator